VLKFGFHGTDQPEPPLAAGTLANLYRYLYSYSMAIMRDAQELSVTEAAQRGVAGLVADAERGSDLVVTRRNHPVAVVVGIARLELLEAAESDLRDLALVLARAATDTGRRTSLDDVLTAFGHTRESLAALPDEDD
jgi:prevent-host-death family protein